MLTFKHYSATQFYDGMLRNSIAHKFHISICCYWSRHYNQLHYNPLCFPLKLLSTILFIVNRAEVVNMLMILYYSILQNLCIILNKCVKLTVYLKFRFKNYGSNRIVCKNIPNCFVRAYRWKFYYSILLVYSQSFSKWLHNAR